MGCKKSIRDGATREEFERVGAEIKEGLAKLGRDYPEFTKSISYGSADVELELAMEAVSRCDLEGLLRDVSSAASGFSNFSAVQTALKNVAEVGDMLKKLSSRLGGGEVSVPTREPVDVDSFVGDYARFLNESYEKIAKLYNNHCECVEIKEVDVEGIWTGRL